MCVEEISGGNSWEAVSRSLNSSSNKSTASFRHSDDLVPSHVFRLLIVRCIGGLGGFEVDGISLKLRNGLKLGQGFGEGFDDGPGGGFCDGICGGTCGEVCDRVCVGVCDACF